MALRRPRSGGVVIERPGLIDLHHHVVPPVLAETLASLVGSGGTAGLRMPEWSRERIVSSSDGPRSVTSDAECKADVDLLERFTQILADLQAPFIAAHRSELTVIRTGLVESLTRAPTYTSQHD